MLLYHIAKAAQWQQSEKEYKADSLKKEKFIHCSFKHQLMVTANRFYPGVPDLVVLEIDPKKLTSPVKMEDSENTGEKFPHVYGPIQKEAVVQVYKLEPDSEGHFTNLIK